MKRRTITSFGNRTSGTSLNSVSRTDNFVNVNVFNTVASVRVLSYCWVLHYFSTIPVGRIKTVTFYKRSIFQVEWLIATLILCISHCSESDSVSSRVFYSAVSTAPRFLLFFNALRRVFKRATYVVRKILSREIKDYNNFTHISNTVDIHSVCRDFG